MSGRGPRQQRDFGKRVYETERASFRSRNFAAREEWGGTIGDFILSDIRLPYKPEPACEQIRSTARCAPPGLALPSLSPRRFDHSKSAGGVWDRPSAPAAALEPFVEFGKYALHGRDVPVPVPRGCARRGGRGGVLKPLRPRSASISPDVYTQLRSRLKAAAYTGHKGRQIDVLFSRCNKDGTGALEEPEVRQALRRVLKIPQTVVSDADIATVFQALDADGNGCVSIQELVDFIGPEGGGGGGGGRGR